MNKIRPLVKAAAVLGAAALLVISVLVVKHNLTDVGRVAEKMGGDTERRLETLECFTCRLTDKPECFEKWPELEDFPDDMVIYKYVEDTLYSWYNVFGPCDDDIRPAHTAARLPFRVFKLSEIGYRYTLANMGNDWYVARKRTFGDVCLISALKLERPGSLGIFDIANLDEGEGSVVEVKGRPLFKVVPHQKTENELISTKIWNWMLVYGVFLFPIPMFLLVLTVSIVFRRKLASYMEHHRRRILFISLLVYFVVMGLSGWAIRMWYAGEPDRVDPLGRRFALKERTDFGSDLMESPVYTFAKYIDKRLVLYEGSYEYPVVFPHDVKYDKKGHASIFVNGRYHFLNALDEHTVVVVSRTDRGLITYFFLYAIIILLLLLASVIFAQYDSPSYKEGRYFSARIRRVLIHTTLISMLVLSTVSVLFVYRRMENSLKNMISGKISAIQSRLDIECADFRNSSEIGGEKFEQALRNLARTTSTTINIYTRSGRFIMSSAGDNCSEKDVLHVDSKSYRSIAFGYTRYTVRGNGKGLPDYLMIYAPLFNSNGQAVGIMGIPYFGADNDFTSDVVFHAVMLIVFFFILLFVAIIILTSITNAIFKPLVEIGRKMDSTDADNLETIEYKREDEISALVRAYNKMVADLKSSTAQMAAAERDKAWSEMARQIAHEIKNPLTPIKLEIQRLVRLKQRNDPSFDQKFDAVANVVLEHVDILSQTANEFGTFAKLYTEEPVGMDLDIILKEQIMLFSDKGAEITYLGIDNALFTGPKPQMVRVFVNMLNNATQAVSDVADPKIVVSLRKGDETGHWTITFEDNGPGVAPENLDKLFTPYFTTKSFGTGLGLAICHSIIDMIGGSISYSRSFNLGGACFSIKL